MDLFTYLQDTFGILATESELNEIKFLVLGEERYIAESNGAKPLVSGALPPYDVELLKRLWVERNPQHEANSDTGEDMFWRTVFMVMADYMQLAGGNDR